MHTCAKQFKMLMVLLLCLPFLTACIGGPYPYKFTAGYLFAASEGIFSDPKVNLKEKNYAAADFLQSKFGKSVSTYHVIKAMPLEELDHPGISSPLGRNISEGVGLRLTELGYNVMLQDVAPYDNADLYPTPTNERAPRYYLKGFYSMDKKDMDVILHLVDAQSNKVVARYDYTMTLSREIKKLSENEPQIFRVKSSL